MTTPEICAALDAMTEAERRQVASWLRARDRTLKRPTAESLAGLHRQCVELGIRRVAFMRGETAGAVFTRLNRAGLTIRKQTTKGKK